MARNRLQQSELSYGGGPAPAQSDNPYMQNQPAASYPPQRQGGGYNSYASTKNEAAYGQQDSYSTGGMASAPLSSGRSDVWSAISSAKAELDRLEQLKNTVASAHKAVLTKSDPSVTQEADQVNAEAQAQRERCLALIKEVYQLAAGNKEANEQAGLLKRRLTRLIEDFRVIEKNYRDESQAKTARQFKIVKPDATQEEVNSVLQGDNPQVFSQALLSTNRYGQARGAFKEVQERHTELLKIEKTMSELNQMFNDMAMLVEQQQESITQVEQVTYDANQNMIAGNEQMDGAVAKARAARKKKIICVAILIVTLVIIAAVLAGVLATQLNKNK